MKSFHLYLYGPDHGPIETSFEQASLRLRELPDLHFEDDGSFVWTQDSGAQQVFGMLYDAASQLQYVELRGTCSLQTWQQLIRAIQGDAKHSLTVLRLPGRQLQELQSFEKSSF